MNWIQEVSEFLNSLVRPLVTLLFAGTVCYLAIKSGVSLSAEALLGQAGTIIAFWFAVRQNEKTVTALAAANKAIATSAVPCPDNTTAPVAPTPVPPVQSPLIVPGGTNVQANPSSPSTPVSNTGTDTTRTPMG